MAEPTVLHAFTESDWEFYVAGHDYAELWQLDDPATLRYERLWMRPIPASAAEDFGVYDDQADFEPTVVRDPATGRFKARVVWIECGAETPGAEPWMGARYAGRVDEPLPSESASVTTASSAGLPNQSRAVEGTREEGQP